MTGSVFRPQPGASGMAGKSNPGKGAGQAGQRIVPAWQIIPRAGDFFSHAAEVI
jgi:hypothetical protein